MDVLSALPRDVSHVRQILFTLPLPFSLSRANQEQFWPLINNVYVIWKTYDVGFRKRDSRPAHQRHKVICRFKRARAAPLISQGKCASSTKRVIIGYDVSFTLLAFSGHYEYYLTSQSEDLNLIIYYEYSYLLDESDASKRNNFLRKLVGAEVAKGYHPAEIISSLTKKGRADVYAQLAAAGGSYLTRQDVINTGLTWRLANPNRLWVQVGAKDNVSL
jgi:hypothetical protein